MYSNTGNIFFYSHRPTEVVAGDECKLSIFLEFDFVHPLVLVCSRFFARLSRASGVGASEQSRAKVFIVADNSSRPYFSYGHQRSGSLQKKRMDRDSVSKMQVRSQA